MDRDGTPKFPAFHFAPPEVRDRLDREGLVSDQFLFGSILDPYDPPAWFQEQAEVERTLEIEDMKPIHLFIPPTDSPEVMLALMTERGTDVREVDISPWISTQNLIDKVKEEVKKKSGKPILMEPSEGFYATYGRGISFKGLPARKRILTTQDDLLHALAMLNIEAKKENNPLTADHVLEVYLFLKHPERVPWSDRNARKIHPERAERIRLTLAQENPDVLLTGRLTKRWWQYFLLALGSTSASLLLALTLNDPLATQWAWVGVTLAGVTALRLWWDTPDRYFLGCDGHNFIVQLTNTPWTIPLEAIRSTMPFFPTKIDGINRTVLHVNLLTGEKIDLPINTCGIPRPAIRTFLDQHVPWNDGWQEQDLEEDKDGGIPLIVFVPPLAQGTKWPWGNNARVAEICCFNPTGVPWMITLRTHIRDGKDLDASKPHWTGPSMGGVVDPGQWRTFRPFPGWRPEQGRRIWFNVSLMNNLTRTPLLEHDYDLEAGKMKSIALADSQPGWTMPPTRSRINRERDHLDRRGPPDLTFPPVPDPDFQRTWAVLVVRPTTRDEYIVEGFPSLEQAREYTRRFVWDSVEELRRPGMDATDLREQWFLFGEDAIVLDGDYAGSRKLDHFIAHPATKEERDWQTCRPDSAPASAASWNWHETFRHVDEYYSVAVSGTPENPIRSLRPIQKIIDNHFTEATPAEKSVLTLVIGPICAGKSTFRHQKLTSELVQLDAGEIYLQLNEGSWSGFGKQLQGEMTFIAYSILERVLKEHWSLAMEWDLTQFHDIKPLIAELKERGWKVVVHDLDCSLETAVARNETREKNNISSHFTTPWHLRWLQNALATRH